MTRPLFRVTALGSLALLSLRCGEEWPSNFGRKLEPIGDAGAASSDAGAHASAGGNGCERACGGTPGAEETPSGGAESPDHDGGNPSVSEGGSGASGNEENGGGGAESQGGTPGELPNHEGGETSSGGNPNTEPPGPSPLFEAARAVLEQHCVACHQSAPHVLLNPDDALRTRLTEPLATNTCNGKVLVVPSSVEASFLIALVQGATDCVRRMPYGCEIGVGACLSDSEVGVLRDWIEAGAPE